MSSPFGLEFASGSVTSSSRGADSYAARGATIFVAGMMAVQLTGVVTPSRPLDELNESTNWTNSGAVRETGSRTRPDLVSVVTADEFASTGDAIQFVRERSGLTWEQLSKVFGVSRRAVHLWSSGKPMNAKHEELLFSLANLVRDLPGASPQERRSLLLRPSPEGPSIYDQLRMDQASAPVLRDSSFSFVRRESEERRRD
jgi:DNA-binding transcriptional regulator YiaG